MPPLLRHRTQRPRPPGPRPQHHPAAAARRTLPPPQPRLLHVARSGGLEGSSTSGGGDEASGSGGGGSGGGEEAAAAGAGSSSRDDPAPAPRLKAGSVVYRAPTQPQGTATAGGGALSAGPGLRFPMTVPLLPFPADEVLTPGGTKVLHLYEARYLALLERALKAPPAGGPALFGHVVVEQPLDPGSNSAGRLRGALVGGDFALALGTLVQVVEVKAQGVGALVRVQAEGRIAVTRLTQAQPYLEGEVAPLPDDPVPAGAEAAAVEAAETLSVVLRECADLCAKFGGTEAAALQQAMLWAERRPLLAGLPGGGGGGGAAGGSPELERAHRLAWAALSALPQASESELRQLLRYRLSAMASASTPDRLQLAASYLEPARAMLSARVALKSLNIGAS